MKKYKKKPVVVKAKRFLKGGDHPMVKSTGLASSGYVIETEEGARSVNIGDWIIKNNKGTYEVLHDKEFLKLYEEV